ncbi:MAG: cytochrome c biogenesis protein ResB [Actinomycetales bacterium]|nr:cytochrome c biogenesis protein ResB [Actinomycetales bacterium]
MVWLRWAWRQLTSMRVALMLLLLLAVAAVPGSFFPQRAQDPAAVAAFLAENPRVGPVLDTLGFFEVYSSPWFMAVYTLLFASLIGCILPRIAQHWRALRSDPPRVPRNFSRFEVRDEFTTPAPPAAVYDAVLGRLRRTHRARLTPEGVTAERGYLRETGNLVFHLALLGILLSFGYGQLATYRGQAVVIEGESFANAVVDYDSFDAGRLVDPASLTPFTFRLEAMEARFSETGRARYFGATVSVTEPGEPARTARIEPNEPLDVRGTRVYLSGNGYAPRLEVRDGAGNLAFSGPVPFLPQDDAYTSTGVVKVPDVVGQDQLGFAGQLLPSAIDDGGTLRSVHPSPANPVLVLQLWRGDLGLDDGVPQNVYQLDVTGMTRVEEDGVPVVLVLAPGDTVELPDGLGTLSFVDLPRFAALDLRHDPSLDWLLGSAVAAMVGLMGSLFIPRRRLWVRAVERDGVTVVSAAALARGEDAGLTAELHSVLKAVKEDG